MRERRSTGGHSTTRLRSSEVSHGCRACWRWKRGGSKGGLAAAVVRRRGWIAVAWVAAGAVLLPAAGRVERTLDVAARIGGSESAAVEQELVRRFASPFAKFAVLVATGVPGPGTPDGRAALEQVVAGLRAVPGLTQCLSLTARTRCSGRRPVKAPSSSAASIRGANR